MFVLYLPLICGVDFMKPIILLVLASYVVFTVVDIICCPILYEKLYYRACFDILDDEEAASFLSQELARRFTYKNSFIPIEHIKIFVIVFNNYKLKKHEEKIYSHFIKNSNTVIHTYLYLKKNKNHNH